MSVVSAAATDIVIPAKAGIHLLCLARKKWIPAFAGMTVNQANDGGYFGDRGNINAATARRPSDASRL